MATKKAQDEPKTAAQNDADQVKDEPKTAAQKMDQSLVKRYFVVNPGGAVAEVTREHARDLIRRPGWRMATGEEINAYLAASIQRADRPIAKPFAEMLAELDGDEPAG